MCACVRTRMHKCRRDCTTHFFLQCQNSYVEVTFLTLSMCDEVLHFFMDERRWWLRLASYVVQKFSDNQLSKYMQWIRSSEIIFLADHEIPRILCNPKVHNPAHNSPLLAPIPSQITIDQNPPMHLRSILIMSNLSAGLSNGLFLSAYVIKRRIFSFSAMYATCPAHLILTTTFKQYPITAFTSARHLSLSWATSIQSIYPHPTSWRSVLILSSHLRFGLPSGLFPSGFPTKNLYTPLLPPIRATCPPI